MKLSLLFIFLSLGLYSQNSNPAIKITNNYFLLKSDTTINGSPLKFKVDSIVTSFRFSENCDSVKFIIKDDSSKYIINQKKFVKNIYQPTETEIYNGRCYCESCLKSEILIKPKKNELYEVQYFGCKSRFKINVTTKQDLIPQKWYQKSYKTGDIIDLENILFYPDKNIFLRTSYDELNGLVELLNLNPNLTIQIQGHVNGPYSKNTDEYQELSTKRAEAVVAFLIKKGIDQSRLSHIGFGNTLMVYPKPNSEQEMKMNRRVTILIK